MITLKQTKHTNDNDGVIVIGATTEMLAHIGQINEKCQ